jgi:hypothetical protein
MPWTITVVSVASRWKSEGSSPHFSHFSWQGARRVGRRAVWEHPARGASKRNAATTGKNKPQ